MLSHHLQAPTTPSEKHLETNLERKVPGWPDVVGPPWNLLISLPVSAERELHALESRLAERINYIFSSVLRTRFQPSIPLSERHLESNQKVQWWPRSWRPPLNLLVALQMSLKESYESLKVSVCNEEIQRLSKLI
jgi:hypothetical protein